MFLHKKPTVAAKIISSPELEEVALSNQWLIFSLWALAEANLKARKIGPT